MKCTRSSLVFLVPLIWSDFSWPGVHICRPIVFPGQQTLTILFLFSNLSLENWDGFSYLVVSVIKWYHLIRLYFLSNTVPVMKLYVLLYFLSNGNTNETLLRYFLSNIIKQLDPLLSCTIIRLYFMSPLNINEAVLYFLSNTYHKSDETVSPKVFPVKWQYQSDYFLSNNYHENVLLSRCIHYQLVHAPRCPPVGCASLT
jgi:hypothetical protein